MTTIKYVFSHMDGESVEFEDCWDAYNFVYMLYPRAFIYSNYGSEIFTPAHLKNTISAGSAALIWDTEEESIDDDGSKAIGIIFGVYVE